MGVPEDDRPEKGQVASKHWYGASSKIKRGNRHATYAAVAVLAGKLHGWECLTLLHSQKQDGRVLGNGGGSHRKDC